MTISTPSLSAQQFSRALSALICQAIQKTGPLSFAEYMQWVLYHPELGYYSNGMEKFGEKGDFITAPEISPLFAQCIAQQMIPIFSELAHPNILEFGAGSGQLVVDILLALESVNQLPEHYYILELSAELKQRQRKKILEKIPQLQNKVIWLEKLPQDFQGVVIANEVLDAMPIHRFCFQENNFWEYKVDCENGILQEKLVSAEAELLKVLLETQCEFAENYSSEINLLLPSWLASLSDCLTRGLVLLLDYGFPRHEYYHPDRYMGTLMCHYQHHAHSDPYFWPGLQDVTAHVDFTAVAEAALSAGFKLAGYTTQAHFLFGCGLMELAAKNSSSIEESWAVSQAIKKLILPSEMGELFKVMALTKEISAPLMGFALKDQSGKL